MVEKPPNTDKTHHTRLKKIESINAKVVIFLQGQLCVQIGQKWLARLKIYLFSGLSHHL